MDTNIKISVRDIRKDECRLIAELLANGLGYQPEIFWLMLYQIGNRPKLEKYPQYGLVLEDNGRIVGTILTIYSRITHSLPEQVRCHLTGWWVEPGYTLYAALLAKVATKYTEVTYINVSARPHTYKIIEAQGFRRYARGQFLVLCPLHLLDQMHLFDQKNDAAIFVHDGPPPQAHRPAELEMMDLHAKYGCVCLWGTVNGEAYPLIFRRRNFKGVWPGAEVIFCRDASDLRTFAGPLSRYFLKQGIAVFSIDANGAYAGLKGRYFDGVEPRFYKGTPPSLGDLAFTLNAMIPFTRHSASKAGSH